ncbi:MAG: dimethylsulfonioproprionate lyase family protein, partial [Pseudomonadota bacterium]
MPDTDIRAADEALLAAIQSYVAECADPAMARFKDGIADWGTEWVEIAPAPLPVSDMLDPMLAQSVRGTHALVDAFQRHRSTRKWEQSYTRADRVVSDEMLSGYGFAEVIGKNGPFLSTRVRAGLGLWGPGIDYPPHRHQAEEIYVPVAGEAVFRLGEDLAEARHGAGSTVYVRSMLTHGFRT